MYGHVENVSMQNTDYTYTKCTFKVPIHSDNVVEEGSMGILYPEWSFLLRTTTLEKLRLYSEVRVPIKCETK
jgi:hypothetical protein